MDAVECGDATLSCSMSNGSELFNNATLGSFMPELVATTARLISSNDTDTGLAQLAESAHLEPGLDLDVYENFLIGTRFWVQRVLVPLIMVIGMIGNSVTIVIMTRRRMRSSTNNYLAALATFDMLYLIFIFVLSFAQYPNIHDTKYYYYWKLWPYFMMITDACSNSSVWLTVTFTIERFIVVSHPIKGKLICTESRSRKVVLAVVLVCFTYTLPTPFEWLIVEKLDPNTNITTVDYSYSDLGKNDLYKSIYYWTTAALFVFVPLLLLGIFNAFLIRSVHISRKERNEMTQSKIHSSPYVPVNNGQSEGKAGPAASSGPAGGHSGPAKFDPNSSRQESKITIMLIAVVILFLCCQLPTAVMLIYTSIREPANGTMEFYMVRGLNNIFNLLMAVNAASNFLLYCLLSKRYRKTFVKVFCPCVKDKYGGYYNSSYHQTTLLGANKKLNTVESRHDNVADNESRPRNTFGHERALFDNDARTPGVVLELNPSVATCCIHQTSGLAGHDQNEANNIILTVHHDTAFNGVSN
ncbi:FMRFamide receptor [Halotydeus destructor]|nr:FMRFamide receptor [Halotydeus destructor]